MCVVWRRWGQVGDYISLGSVMTSCPPVLHNLPGKTPPPDYVDDDDCPTPTKCRIPEYVVCTVLYVQQRLPVCCMCGVVRPDYISIVVLYDVVVR